ncbi:MAG TPA: ABC transporter ATP-binding protein [Clostridia bacterium]|nr:MAG: putative ABC transporter ATP-binding protein YbhF [Firmicutes bacterium ADurb.Bin146]HQM38717.1 ABC transporter ATP-binding protein [Clostridia bacterium]
MTAIKTLNLTKKFKDKTAVKNLNLEIKENELFSLLGVNGAGKTTTIKMLSCLIKPTDGDAYIFDKSIVKDDYDIKQFINVSPQETAVAPNLTVEENLQLIAGIYGNNKEASRKKVSNIMNSFSLNEVAKDRANKLSGGYQRRLSIAMALISEPKLLFLDEPTLGLDVLARRELWKIIKKLKQNITIILTTHYLEESVALSDRIGIMVKGELKIIGTADEIMKKAGKDNFEDAFIALSESEAV